MRKWIDMTIEERAAMLREASIEAAVAAGGQSTNARELECWHVLTQNAFFARRGGWPDFLCESHGANEEACTFAVEVKRHPEDHPRQEQLQCMTVLERAGIPCFVWDRHTGFRRMGSLCMEGQYGRQPMDREMPGPSLPRCGLCARCGGTGLDPNKLSVVP